MAITLLALAEKVSIFSGFGVGICNCPLSLLSPSTAELVEDIIGVTGSVGFMVGVAVGLRVGVGVLVGVGFWVGVGVLVGAVVGVGVGPEMATVVSEDHKGELQLEV